MYYKTTLNVVYYRLNKMLDKDQILSELEQVKTAEALEEWFQKYLGKK